QLLTRGIASKRHIFLIYETVAVDIADEEADFQSRIGRCAAVADDLADLEANDLSVRHPAEWDDDLLAIERWSSRPRASRCDADLSAGDIFGIGQNDAAAVGDIAALNSAAARGQGQRKVVRMSLIFAVLDARDGGGQFR